MTMRENILTYHQQTCSFKDHLWTDHKERDMGVQAIAYYESGVNMALPIGQLEYILDQTFYKKGRKFGVFPTSFDAAIHMCLISILKKKEIPGLKLDDQGQIKAGDKLRAVVIAIETFTCPEEYESAIGIENQPEGDERIKEDFENNPNSQVFESLMTFIIEDDLCGGVEWAGAAQGYKITDGGVLEWGDDITWVISDTDGLNRQKVANTVRTTPALRSTIPYFNIEVS